MKLKQKLKTMEDIKVETITFTYGTEDGKQKLSFGTNLGLITTEVPNYINKDELIDFIHYKIYDFDLSDVLEYYEQQIKNNILSQVRKVGITDNYEDY